MVTPAMHTLRCNAPKAAWMQSCNNEMHTSVQDSEATRASQLIQDSIAGNYRRHANLTPFVPIKQHQFGGVARL
jgi:hypothetical protein